MAIALLGGCKTKRAECERIVRELEPGHRRVALARAKAPATAGPDDAVKYGESAAAVEAEARAARALTSTDEKLQAKVEAYAADLDAMAAAFRGVEAGLARRKSKDTGDALEALMKAEGASARSIAGIDSYCASP